MSATEQLARKVQTLDEATAREVLDFVEQRIRDEEQDDLAAAKRALAEPGKNIPWEKVRAEAGLV